MTYGFLAFHGKHAMSLVPLRPIFARVRTLSLVLLALATMGGVVNVPTASAGPPTIIERIQVQRGKRYETPFLGMTKRDAKVSFGRPDHWRRVPPKQQRWVYERVRLDNGVRIVQEDVLLFDRQSQLIGLVWGTTRAGVRLEN